MVIIDIIDTHLLKIDIKEFLIKIG